VIELDSQKPIRIKQLLISFDNHASLLIKTQKSGSHCYELDGIQNFSGMWSLPLSCENAKIELEDLPTDDATRVLIALILASRCWRWSSHR
jgi:hypothetical protein